MKLLRTGFELSGNLLTGFLCLSAFGFMQAATNEWFEGPDLSLARAGYAAGVLDGRYVLAGGTLWDGNTKIWTSRVDIFEPRSRKWTEGPALPEPRADAASVSLEGALYVIGGGNGRKTYSDVLMLRQGRWSRLSGADIPEPRLYAVAVATAPFIYLFGGVSKPGDYTSASSTLWKLEPNKLGARWESLPGAPGPGLINAAATTYQSAIYIFGGAEANGKRGVKNRSSVLQFDCHLQRWTTLPDLRVERRCWWAVNVGRKALLIGGYSSTFCSEVLEYSFSDHSLRLLNRLPQPVCDARFFRVGHVLWGAGGEVGDHIRSARLYGYKIPFSAELTTQE